jgi:hypothetical protein
VSWNDWTDEERRHYMQGVPSGIRPVSDRLSWTDLTDEERVFWMVRGSCPYDRGQDRTAEEMRPVYAARGYKRQPPSVRGYWDNYTDEEYARRFRHFNPEILVLSLRRRGMDRVCVHPETLAAAAKYHVEYLRKQQAAARPRP